MFVSDKDKCNEIAATIRLFHKPDSICEVRILNTCQNTMSGYFDDAEELAKIVEQHIGVYNIYFTPNPPDPKLLKLSPRNKNKLIPYASRTTSDGEIAKINWLLVDIDPVRKSGTASTNGEKREAYELASAVLKGLRKDFGFPEPIICDSGNGFHLLYFVDLENTPENIAILKNLLIALDVLYSTDTTKVDRVTFNPARITKLYGVKSMKGNNSSERPHRFSSIKKVPKDIVTVTVDAMNSVINSLPKADDADDTPITDTNDMSNGFDIEKWIADAKLNVAFAKDTTINGKDATVYVLDVCPWNEEHTNRSARIVKFKNGGISAGCFHDSCSGKNWHSLRDIVEPGWRDKVKKPKKPKKGNGDSEDGETHFDRIMRICEDITFFYDRKEEALARIQVKDSHIEVYAVESEKFKRWVAHKYYLETSKAFSADAWKQAMGAIIGKALFEGKEEHMYKRCAWHDGVIYYDLADKEKRIVRITEDGWAIVQTADVLFYRHKTMSEQVEPVHGVTSLKILDKHYKFKHPDDKILHHVSLITKFLAHVPHPLDVVHGEKGASKSTTLRKDKSIVDPNRCDIWTFPKKRDDLAVLLDNHYFLCFDNMSSISSEMSNLLCMASTGGAFSKRKLYSNNEEVVLEFMQPVSLNGVNTVATKSDLLDRSLLLELDRLSAIERKTERELWDEFNADKPKILGLIFTILSKAIGIFPTIKLDKLGRMADFTLWGYAVAQAAGIGGEKFLSAYLRNQDKANIEAVEAHPIAYAITKFMTVQSEWIGTATELLKKLADIAEDEEIDTKSYLWVRQPNQLTRKIREVKSNLEQMGLTIEIKPNGNRAIKITNSNL